MQTQNQHIPLDAEHYQLLEQRSTLLEALTNERNGCIETIVYCQRWLKTLRDGLHNAGNRSAVESVEVVINNLENLDAKARAAITKATGAAPLITLPGNTVSHGEHHVVL